MQKRSTAQVIMTYITVTLSVIVVIVGFLEISSRWLDGLQNGVVAKPWAASIINRTLPLDDFERASDQYVLHWGLRPGYRHTSAKIAEQKLRDGKALGAKAYRPDASARPTDPSAFHGVAVNASGFRGAELDQNSDRIKILSIGDSVTFGLGEVSYPAELKYQFFKDGLELDVINAGVEGYGIRNHMIELERYKELEPEVVIMFLGWNDLFGIDVPLPGIFACSAMASRVNRLLERFNNPPFIAGRFENLEHLDLAENTVLRQSIIAGVNSIVDDYGRLVQEFKSKNVEVIVLTLPTFLRPGASLNKKLMTHAQLPAYSLSPSEFASTISLFNQLLKEAAQKWNVHIVDVSEWSKDVMQPPHTHFLDTVHFSARGLKKLSLYLYQFVSQKIPIEAPNSRAIVK